MRRAKNVLRFRALGENFCYGLRAEILHPPSLRANLHHPLSILDLAHLWITDPKILTLLMSGHHCYLRTSGTFQISARRFWGAAAVKSWRKKEPGLRAHGNFCRPVLGVVGGVRNTKSCDTVLDIGIFSWQVTFCFSWQLIILCHFGENGWSGWATNDPFG